MEKSISLGNASIVLSGSRLQLESEGLKALLLLPDDSCKTVRLGELLSDSGYNWGNIDSCSPLFFGRGEELTELREASLSEEDQGGVSERFLRCRLEFAGRPADVVLELQVFPGASLFTVRWFARRGLSLEAGENAGFDSGLLLSLEVPERQYRIHSAELFDCSDGNNTYVLRQTDYGYRRAHVRARGHFFALENYPEKETLLLVREAPSRQSAQNVRWDWDFSLFQCRLAQLWNGGMPEELPAEYLPCYEVTLGCRSGDNAPEELLRCYRDYYRMVSTGRPADKLTAISNTWGDRSRGENLCDGFLCKEIEAAAALGIDAVQVDDGYNTEDWQVRKDRFPDGFWPEVRLCREKGLEFGIWFVPDETEDYANWQRDAEILLGYYKTYGITQMKVDGVTLNSRAGEENLRKLFEKVVRESHGRVQINNDITASRRFGFLYRKEFANLFVENRYTAWGNYYPHYVLRNVWQLAKFVPTRRLLVEVANRGLFRDAYAEEDLFAPWQYRQDYLFAVSCFANPLIWMEMQNLKGEDFAKMQAILAAYRPHREALFRADVTPIGKEPDGIALTGLRADLERFGYLLVFCEYETGTIAAEVPGVTSAEILYAGGDEDKISVNTAENTIVTEMREPRSFVFLRYEKSR